ncbi:MAG: FlgD immunoglobulin-like domain containing protein [bacterium]
MKGQTLCVAMILMLVTSAFAQEPVGGPYTPDANTVLLLHFDGDLNNAASTGGAATANGDVTYVDGMPGFGKAVFLDNHTLPDTTQGDTTYLSFDAIPELNLLGDFTIEGWFKYADTLLFEGNDPSYLISKSDIIGRYNYVVRANFDGTQVPGSHLDVPNVMGTFDSPPPGNNFPIFADGGVRVAIARFEDSKGTPLPEQLGTQWLHFTFQRSTALKVISIAIHDQSGELLYFDYRQTHPKWEPVPSTLPLLLGRARESTAGFFHGYLDEIRISNTLRYMDLPPVILYQSYLREPIYARKIGNQLDTQTEYPFHLNIAVLGSDSGVQSATIFYRTVNDQYEKVAADDPSWKQVAMTQGAGVEWTGAIPQHPLGTVIQYYHTATSTTGLTTTFGANPDSSYDRFGVMKEKDIVLKLSFEETDLNFVDSSRYNHKLNKIGFWALNDDEDVPEGDIAAHLIEGTNAFGEIVSPFLSLEEYTITVWVNPDSFTHNIYIVSNVPGANFRDSYINVAGIGPFTQGDWFRPNYTLLLRDPAGSDRVADMGNDVFIENLPTGVGIPWSHDRIRVPLKTVGVWTHYMINLGPDSLVIQVNDEDNMPVERVVVTKEDLKVDEIIPFAPSIGKFRIGPPAIGAGQPFYMGKLDELVVYNYQWDPPGFGPIVGVKEDIASIPKKYELSQNYPNPFNPETSINFTIPSNQEVKLDIYDLLGKRVKTLLNRKMEAGMHTIAWDGTNDSGQTVASGTYFYQLRTKGFKKTKKMVLIR